MISKKNNGCYGNTPKDPPSVLSTAYALLAFKILNYTPPDLNKSISYIIYNQQEDGGWGEEKSERLSHDTLYCLWTLKEYNSLSSEIKMKAIKFIKNLQGLDGGFYENYYKMHNRIHASLGAVILSKIILNSTIFSLNDFLDWIKKLQRQDGGFPGAGGYTFVKETVKLS